MKTWNIDVGDMNIRSLFNKIALWSINKLKTCHYKNKNSRNKIRSVWKITMINAWCKL